MHSPPIDLRTSAPKPQKAAPSESEPDGRFSELLRGSSEAEAKQPDAATDPKSKPAVTAEGSPEAEPPVVADQKPVVKPGTDAAVPEAPVAEENGIASLVVHPEAITWTQPQSPPLTGAVAKAPSELLAGASVPQTPTPEGGTITPPLAPATASNSAAPPVSPGGGIGVPAAPRSQLPAIPANPVEKGNAVSPASPVNPVDGAGAASQAKSGNPGAIAIAQSHSSPIARTQSAIATAGPILAAGKAVAGGDVSGEAPRPSAAAPAGPAASDTLLSNQPASAIAAAPDRSATTKAATSVAGQPPALKDTPDSPATAPSKAGPDLSQTRATLPAPGAVATPTAASPAADRPVVAAATAVPSTVAETADAALPTSQADPVAAANSSPIGRMTATATASTALSHSPTTAQPAAEQVFLQVQRGVREGIDRLTMQLKPASLGRVDIQMEVGFDGRLQAVISAERPETLHLLQRDARTLTEALNDAGLQTDSGSLSFDLRGQAGEHGDGSGQEPIDATAASRLNAADEPNAATTEITLTLGDGRVDIKV